METQVNAAKAKSLEELVWSDDATQDSGKAYVDCTVDYVDGNVHLIFPQNTDIAKMRQTAGGNVFIALKGEAIDLNIVKPVVGGDPKERVMVTYPFAARLNFKLK